jgi:hypothetical protein
MKWTFGKMSLGPSVFALLLLAGCGNTPSRQFAALASSQEPLVRQTLTANEARLLEYSHKFRNDGQVGIISFRYELAVANGSERKTIQVPVTAEYTYSDKLKRWELQAFNDDSAGHQFVDPRFMKISGGLSAVFLGR